MKIIYKFILIMASMISLIIVNSVVTMNVANNHIKHILTEETTAFVVNQIAILDKDIERNITLIETFARQSDVLDLVNRSNMIYDSMKDAQIYIDGMDKEWISSKEQATALFIELSKNELSREINKMIILHNRGNKNGRIGETFITNRWGAVVGLTNKTSYFKRDDTEWWQRAKKDGLYIDSLSYDESSASWNMAISVALHLPDGTFVGVIKSGIRVEWVTENFGSLLKEIFRNTYHQQNFHWYVMTSDGRVLYSSEPFTFLQKVPNNIDFEQIQSLGTGSFNSDDGHINIFAVSKGLGRFSGKGWVLLLQHDTEYMFGFMKKIRNQIIFVIVITILIGIMLFLRIWKYISHYTNQITAWIKEINQGGTAITSYIGPNDELGKLANALHSMLNNLTIITVSRDKLQQEIQERKEIEKLLREERDFNSLLLNSTGEGIYGIDPTGRCIFINQIGLKLLGFSTVNEVLGQDIHELIHHTRADGSSYSFLECPVHSCMISIFSQQMTITDDIFWRCDNSNFPVEYSTHAILKDEIKVGAMVIFRDITVRMESEKIQRENQERYHQIVETSMDGFWIINNRGRFQYVNNAYCQLSGYTYDELLNMSITDIELEENRGQTAQYIQKIINEGHYRFETHHRHKSGNLLTIEVSAVYRKNFNSGMFFGFLRDITEKKRIEEILIESEKKFRKIIESAQNAIIMMGPDGCVSLWNEAAEHIFGYSIAEAMGQDLHKLIAPPAMQSEFLQAFPHFLKTGKGPVINKTIELISLCKNGKELLIELSISSMQLGNQWHAIGIVRDITSRKRSEVLIEKSLKEKELLLREIHHRVKNNIQVIISLLRLEGRKIKDEYSLSVMKDTQKKIMAIALIHELLYRSSDISKIDFEIYIRDLASKILGDYNAENNIRLNLDIQHIYIPIKQATPCGLIINEIISNATKHAFPNNRRGQITISLHKSDDDEVELKVSDDGVGIPVELDIDRIDSMGIKLIIQLTEAQLLGTAEMERNGGTMWRIRFTLSN
ncbi:two-component system, sensor histidine kinase PdtaS [Gammaproteobacteria bacterium]